MSEEGPVIIDRGEGVYVYDDHGRGYLEGNSGLWNVVLGFDNPKLIEAAQRAYAKLPAYHAFFGRVAQSALDLSERLVKLAPMPADRVFYANSGSEANDTVVKLLWFLAEAEGKPHRRLLLSRKNAYHGMTVMTASLTGKDYVKAFSGLPLPEVRFLTCPHSLARRPGRVRARRSSRAGSPSSSSRRSATPGRIHRRLLRRAGAGRAAASSRRPRAISRRSSRCCAKYGIPLIADEVICGFGRTGEFWGSHQIRHEARHRRGLEGRSPPVSSRWAPSFFRPR